MIYSRSIKFYLKIEMLLIMIDYIAVFKTLPIRLVLQFTIIFSANKMFSNYGLLKKPIMMYLHNIIY